MPTVRAIVRDAAQQDYRLSAFIQGVIRSQAFRMMQAPATETSAVAAADKAEGKR
jgi:hypothetical protein